MSDPADNCERHSIRSAQVQVDTERRTCVHEADADGTSAWPVLSAQRNERYQPAVGSHGAADSRVVTPAAGGEGGGDPARVLGAGRQLPPIRAPLHLTRQLQAESTLSHLHVLFANRNIQLTSTAHTHTVPKRVRCDECQGGAGARGYDIGPSGRGTMGQATASCMCTAHSLQTTFEGTHLSLPQHTAPSGLFVPLMMAHVWSLAELDSTCPHGAVMVRTRYRRTHRREDAALRMAHAPGGSRRG